MIYFYKNENLFKILFIFESSHLFIEMKKLFLLFLITTLLFLACNNENKKFIDFKHPEIKYQGRIDSSNLNAAGLFWSGTAITLNFEGSSVEALLQDETGDNYYNILVDGELREILKPDTIKRFYSLASNLTAKQHQIVIFKRTEYNRGRTQFYGFRLEQKARIFNKDPDKKRKLEFYGNSITAGYAVEDLSGKDSPDSTYTNNYLSYAALTARHFDAEYQCICKSGIGISISWFPQIMPEIYNRLNPTDPLSQWDFSLYQPNIVVINLFQNDSWLVNRPECEEFKEKFGNVKPSDEYLISAYQEFVCQVRMHYPNSKIVCILGSMDATKKGSIWPAYIEKAVSHLEDENIYTHFIPYKETLGHPSIKEQEEMAESLIQFIDKNIKW